MVVQPLSKSARLKTPKWVVPTLGERPRDPYALRTEPEEALRGEIRGQAATDIEERLFYALASRYGANRVEFQPTVLGDRNVAGEVRPDFVVTGVAMLRIYFADGEYAHKTAEAKAKDNLDDQRLFNELQGTAEYPIRIPGDDLQTQEDADRAVRERE